jgi:prepilin-type N-terminal cleavage/methylation domain-containing protein
MSFRPFYASTTNRKGFSLVELAVVVIIIGVLAAFGVPRMLKSVERSKAAEAFKHLASVRAAQERYQGREGTYAAVLTDLDITQSTPKYYTVGVIAAGGTLSLEDSWTLTLTRVGASAGYGAYTVTFTEDGYDSVASSIETLPDINPMGGGAPPPPPP